uniref:Endonuclease/exonuclease/phosphatase domain-containing protein n=1 Tax=Clytia hemisphaerica TaxID=252671 RepID=A0A7M5UVA7_9CNID
FSHIAQVSWEPQGSNRTGYSTLLFQPLDNMNSSLNRSRVEAPDFRPFQPIVSTIDSNDGDTPNPTRRVPPDDRRKKGLFNQRHHIHIAQLNCRTLNSLNSRKEIVVHLEKFNIPICSIQEHRFLHNANDPEIIAQPLNRYTLFTASAWKAANNATIGGVGIIIRTDLLPILSSVRKISNRIIIAEFRGNPKSSIISCYSPHSGYDEKDIERFYTEMRNLVLTIPSHSFLAICGDFNARITGNFSYHSICNQNGDYLQEFIAEFNLFSTNTSFKKRTSSLWTWKSPTGDLSQIDYILCRKKWRNTIHDSQAHSSSDPIGSDHRIVVTKCKLSLRAPKTNRQKALNWKELADPTTANSINENLSVNWENCTDKSYKSFTVQCINTAKTVLPNKERNVSIEPESVAKARTEVLNAPLEDVSSKQQHLKATHYQEEETRINIILDEFDKSKSTNSSKNAWKLVKELSGKKKPSTCFISGDDRLKTWKDHFQKLLNNVTTDENELFDPQQIFELNENISTGDFTMTEIESAIK